MQSAGSLLYGEVELPAAVGYGAEQLPNRQGAAAPDCREYVSKAAVELLAVQGQGGRGEQRCEPEGRHGRGQHVRLSALRAAFAYELHRLAVELPAAHRSAEITGYAIDDLAVEQLKAPGAIVEESFASGGSCPQRHAGRVQSSGFQGPDP